MTSPAPFRRLPFPSQLELLPALRWTLHESPHFTAFRLTKPYQAPHPPTLHLWIPSLTPHNKHRLPKL